MSNEAPSSATAARRPLIIGGLALVVLIGVLGYWGVTARIAGAVIASGMIQLENNRQVIQHPQGGVVGDLRARDGDVVEAGEIVLTLDDTILRSELSIIESQLNELSARKARLIAERDNADTLEFDPDLLARAAGDSDIHELVAGQADLFEARRITLGQEAEQLSAQIIQTGDQIVGAEAQMVSIATQMDLIENELEDVQALFDKGLAQASRLSELQREAARLLGQSGATQAEIARLRNDIARLEVDKLRLRTSRREEAISLLRDLEVQERELRERLITVQDSLSKMAVRTPVSGVVHGSRIFAVQSVITAAEPIMYVIPQDQPLIVSARIEAIHIDQVYEGQSASLRFVAFDQRLTPELFGTVTNLSADVFTDEITGLSYYQAEVLPLEGELAKLGDQALLPGMPVETFVRTDDRSPVSYLIKPLMDYFYKAFREA